MMTGGVEMGEQLIEAHCGSPPIFPELHQTDVHRNAVEPGAEFSLASKVAEATRCGDKCILQGIGGIVVAPEHAPRYGQHLRSILAHELLARRAVSTGYRAG